MISVNKKLNRNAAETLIFNIKGDYSADTIYLTAKRNASDTVRLIDHECDDIDYDSESDYSTLTFNILPSETQNIGYSILVYDIKVENSSSDREALVSGNLTLNLLPRLDSDVAPSETNNALIISLSDLEDDTILYKTKVDGVDALISKSVSEMKSLLGLPSKVYKAFVDCNGTNAPTVTILKNTFTGTMTWAWSETGVITLTSTNSEFTINKTHILASVNRLNTDRTVNVSRDNSLGALIAFKTFQTDGNAVDNVDFFLTIEVYE